jgi:hypothetical protein
MKKGDKIRITAGERTVDGKVNTIADDGRSMFVSFDGALSLGGVTLFSNTALFMKNDGRWREAISGIEVEVGILL